MDNTFIPLDVRTSEDSGLLLVTLIEKYVITPPVLSSAQFISISGFGKTNHPLTPIKDKDTLWFTQLLRLGGERGVSFGRQTISFLIFNQVQKIFNNLK